MSSNQVRMPAVAGMFYPAPKDELAENIHSLLLDAQVKSIQGTPVALISPHAGYQYSGPTAAHGFQLLTQHTFDAIVIVSPSHREYFDGISVYDGKAYATSFGEMLIEEHLRDELLASDNIIEASDRGHGQEHAIEVQLPFIQTILGNVRILPIVIGDQRREYCFHLGEKLGSVLKEKKVLLIASTDLSHYHSYEMAQELDKIIIDDVAAFDYERLMHHLETEQSEACGGGPTVAVMLAAKKLGANRVQVLSHCNSGDITGDHRRVVGYLSAAILQTQ
jgi:AmmeMemoRadiSam system protein B